MPFRRELLGLVRRARNDKNVKIIENARLKAIQFLNFGFIRKILTFGPKGIDVLCLDP